MKTVTRKPILIMGAVVGACFLLTSTGYLAWVYNVLELTPAPESDAVTLIAGYLFQAAGIGLFALVLRRRSDMTQEAFYAALGLHMLSLIPAVLSSSPVQAIAFGLVLNLFCGMIAGYYLYRLAYDVDRSHSAIALGAGYSISILISWMLSLIKGGTVYYSNGILVICLVITLAVFFAARIRISSEESFGDTTRQAVTIQKLQGGQFKRFMMFAGALILLFSIVNSCGFGFPSVDVAAGVNVEFSRLFYAAGLIIAGLGNNRNRRYGAICAVIALIIPFLMLAIRGEAVSAMIFWVLSYFAFGFYTVYRIILFSDIAREKKMLYLSGCGLLIGRVGDALGETLCLTFSKNYLVLVGITAFLFMLSVLLFFLIYQYLYLPESRRDRSEREIFNHFSSRHDLSVREREVLRFLLEEKTNAQIADELSISDGTVKYHIHNLLQKTSCRNRLELLSAYAAEQDTK